MVAVVVGFPIGPYNRTFTTIYRTGDSSEMSRQSSETRYGKWSETKPSDPPYEWKGFVDIPLSESDKVRFKEWNVEADDILSLIETAVTDGYKLSVTLDTRNSCYQASLTGLAGAPANVGNTMSGRGGSPVKSLAVLMYKHFEIAQQGVWGNTVSPGNKDDIS